VDADKSALRTVDCLQRLYALLLALATAEAFKKFVGPHAATSPSSAGGEGSLIAFDVHWDLLPQLITIVLTVAPFFHGMHRHLDQAYGEPIPRDRWWMRLYFLVDFLLSWIGFALFFTLQMTMPDPRSFSAVLALIFLVNAIWSIGMCFVGHDPKKQYVFGWLALNSLCAIAASMLAGVAPREWQSYGCLGIALFHFVIDYGCFWKIYFPEPDKKPGTV
jgi:hypothetical protein